MNMTLRNYIASIALFFAIGLALGLYLAHRQEPVTAQSSGSTVVSAVTTTLHPVVMKKLAATVPAEPAACVCEKTVPVLAQDKHELAEQGVEPPWGGNEEVTATGKISDAAGTTTASNVLNTDDGKSHLAFTRKTAEWIDKWSIAAGVSAGSLGYGFQGEAETVLFRIKDVYADLRLDGWKWEGGSRREAGHAVDGQAAALMRYNF